MTNTDSPGPVVVGIDGSDAAIGAARWAAKDAVHQDVALRLVYVIETTDGPSASRSDYPADDQYAERSLHAARLAVEATGLPVPWQVRWSSSAQSSPGRPPMRSSAPA